MLSTNHKSRESEIISITLKWHVLRGLQEWERQCGENALFCCSEIKAQLVRRQIQEASITKHMSQPCLY